MFTDPPLANAAVEVEVEVEVEAAVEVAAVAFGAMAILMAA